MFPDEKKAQFLPFKELLLTSTFPNQGFTMLEVLAALMISFAFLMGALNGITMAVWMQVKAERQAQAGYWIQQTLEGDRSQAANLSLFSPSQTQCNSATFSGGTGELLQNALTPTNANLAPKTFLGKTYRIARDFSTNASANPATPKILRVTYTVGEDYASSSTSGKTDTNSDGIVDSQIVTSLYTEITPAPAMACP
jgi:prepilin-type N-terminal cleavage/methylation domain-containing protein